MKYILPKTKNPGNQEIIEKEEKLENVEFNVYKFNNRERPVNLKDRLVISCFSEFGCEIVGAMYCIPRILQENAGKYSIAVGWHGREYLYRHLVDEFWEIKEPHQWLREYCRAFHHVSNNLKKVELFLSKQGHFISSDRLGRYAVGNRCNKCKAFWGDTSYIIKCRYCGSKDVIRSLFGDINYWKPLVKKFPLPSAEKLAIADNYLGKNPVGIFARGRKCYGRNLQPEFYVKLIALLEKMNYTPIWLGEKQSSQPCPVEHIIDFSRMVESKDLELTFAIISKLKFTIQYWTASTRLASVIGVPFLLFESPDQIMGAGQEGYRLNLCVFGKKKLVFSDFLNVYNDNDKGINLTEEAIKEMEVGNWDNKVGMVENKQAVEGMLYKHKHKKG